MKMSQFLKSAVLGLSLVAAAPAFASDDSSADAAPGFRDASTSAGVLIRVPIDEQGRELTNAAEMRVHKGANLGNQSVDLKAVFDSATSIPAEAVARDSSTSASGDSSTNHSGYNDGYNSCNNGWSSWYGNSGWQPSYYYSSYTPTYYYYSTTYSYSQPQYYNYYTNYNSCDYYGYRYYYYQHSW